MRRRSMSWPRRSPPERCGWRRRRRRGCGWGRSSTPAAGGTGLGSAPARNGWPGRGGGGWHGPGIRSCAEWLAWQCGLGPGAAREHVRVARALTALPRTEAAFAAGRLSYSKVRAMTRIAEPDWETSLLEFALSATASQTERFCRQWRRTEDETAGRVRPAEEVVFDYR